jgi:hypothetical protein
MASVVTNNTTKQFTIENYTVPTYGGSFLVGLDIPITKRIDARLAYAQGFGKEKLDQKNGSQYDVNMRRVELTLMYQFVK